MNNDSIQISELTLIDILLVAWKRKVLIILTSLIFGFIGVASSYMVDKTFRAESTLIPADRYAGSMRSPDNGRGLSSLIGFTSGGNTTDYIVLGVETIKSRNFIRKFLKNNNLEPYYSSVKSYNLSSQKFTFNEKIYDVKNDKWSDEAIKNKLVPSDQALYKNFMEKTVFTRDMANNTLKLYTIHESPILAKEVNYLLIKALNEELSNFDKNLATNSMNYIGERLAKTDGLELRQILSGLYVNELEKQMLTEVQDEYVFRTLDPAVVPINKYKPSRLQFLIAFAMSGFFISLLIAIFQGLTKVTK